MTHLYMEPPPLIGESRRKLGPPRRYVAPPKYRGDKRRSILSSIGSQQSRVLNEISSRIYSVLLGAGVYCRAQQGITWPQLKKI